MSTLVRKDSNIAVAMAVALDMLGEAGALTPISLDLHEDITFERAEALAGLLGRVKRSTSWWIGDLINFGEATYGEKYAQMAHATGLAETTLMNYSYVCRQVPKSRRKESVPFSCHYEVASLTPKEQKYWLGVCAREGLTQRDLRARLRETEGDAAGSDGAPAQSGAASSVDLARIARGVVHHAVKDGNGYHRVPSEWIAQLGAAVGEDD